MGILGGKIIMLLNKKASISGAVTTLILFIIGSFVMLGIANDSGYTQQFIGTYNNTQTNGAFNSSVQLPITRLDKTTISVQNASNLSLGLPNTIRIDNEFGVSENEGRIFFVNRTGTWAIYVKYKPNSYVDDAASKSALGVMPILVGVSVLIGLAYWATRG